MLKKAIMSAAIASTLAMTGCLDTGKPENKNSGATTDSGSAAAVWPLFFPATGKLPLPNDLIFGSDGSFEVDDSAPPVTTALNGLSGASTVAPIDIAMSGLVDESTVAAGTSVFLIALDYASGQPLQGLLISEPPAPAAEQPSYSAEVKTLDGVSYVRINPVTPLNPLTRYVVVLTKDITNTAGEPIRQAPGAAGYELITGDQDLPSPALEPIRALMNGLWEPTAIAAIPSVSSDDDIALSYSFTTSGDESVLGYMAEPNTWFADQLTSFISLSTVEATLAANPAADFAALETQITGTIAAFPAIPIDENGTTLEAALSPIFDFAPPNGCQGLTGETAIGCTGVALAANFAPLLPNLTTTVSMTNAATVDLNAVAPAALGIPAGVFSVTPGTLTVPYYSGVVNGNDASALKYSNWVADSTLATAINAAFGPLGLELPQADPSVSTVVNYIFPFPQKQADVTIPILAIYANGGTDMKTMIWQHGITGNRTNALGFGSAFVAQMKLAAMQDTALLAIDLPLHGVDDSNDPSFAFNTPVERHFNFQEAGPRMPPEPIDLTTGEGSGSMFINLENLLTSRDSIRQHVLDLFTLRNSLGTISLNGGETLDSDKVFYAGHSLGTFSGQVFASVSTQTAATTDDLTAASFFTPGGGITRLVENSQAFGPTVVSGLASSALTPDTSSYQTYLNVLQHALDSADGINYVDGFGSTPVHYMEAIGDTVIPNSVDTAEETLTTTLENGVMLDGSISFLAGSEPLTVVSGATTVTESTTFPTEKPYVVTRFVPEAANHGTPSTADPATGFSELVGQTVSIVASDGAAITVTDSSLLSE